MNDKSVVERNQDSFDVLVIQGNLAASTHRGLSSWQDLRKPFWIDPITYAFVAAPAFLMSHQKIRGTDRSEFTFKKTFRALSEAYGPPFSPLEQSRLPLSPGDFNPATDDDVVRRIIDWQRSVLTPPPEDQKYVEIENLEPVLLTIPYFPLTLPNEVGSDPEWLDVNLRLVRAGIDAYSDLGERLVAGLLIEDNLFDSDSLLDSVIDRYLDLPIKHLWLWLSEIDETGLTAPRAQRLRSLIERAEANGKVIHQAFAGGYSPLLLSRGLQSVGHGVMYWEHKNWQPLAGGGLPTLRYYFPPVRARLRFLDADLIVSEMIASADRFHAIVCGCSTCVSALSGNLDQFARFGQVQVRTRLDAQGRRREYDVPTPSALALCKSHYLRSRGEEIRDASAPGFDPSFALRAAIREFADSSSADLRHLRNWLAALS